RRTIAHGQRGSAANPDERPPGPGAPVLRGFEQEGPRAVPRELAVHPQRGLVVRQQAPHHRNHPAALGELAELLSSWADTADLTVADHRVIVPPGGADLSATSRPLPFPAGTGEDERVRSEG